MRADRVDKDLGEDRDRLVAMMAALVGSFPKGFHPGEEIDVHMHMNFEAAMCMLTALRFAADYLGGQTEQTPIRLH